MNYFTTKKSGRDEYRIYFDLNVGDKKNILYSGHNLGLELKDLLQFLDYRVEKSTGTYFFLDYGSLENYNLITTKNFTIKGNITNLDEIVWKSWDTLKSKLENNGNKLKRISIMMERF